MINTLSKNWVRFGKEGQGVWEIGSGRVFISDNITGGYKLFKDNVLVSHTRLLSTAMLEGEILNSGLNHV